MQIENGKLFSISINDIEHVCGESFSRTNGYKDQLFKRGDIFIVVFSSQWAGMPNKLGVIKLEAQELVYSTHYTAREAAGVLIGGYDDTQELIKLGFIQCL